MKSKEKIFLLIDDKSPNFYVGRRLESELKPEITEGLGIGDIRSINGCLAIQRES